MLCAFEAARAGLEEGKREGPVTVDLIEELLSTVRRAARAEPAMAKKLPLFHQYRRASSERNSFCGSVARPNEDSVKVEGKRLRDSFRGVRRRRY